MNEIVWTLCQWNQFFELKDEHAQILGKPVSTCAASKVCLQAFCLFVPFTSRGEFWVWIHATKTLLQR